MREIKFRSWANGRMNYAFHPVQHGEYNFFLFSSACRVYDPDVILMESTGLYDKNGKEIYEGDIIKLYPSDKSGVQILWDEHIAGFGFGNQTMADHLNFRKLTAINYEVIGNVYENPELLKGK